MHPKTLRALWGVTLPDIYESSMDVRSARTPRALLDTPASSFLARSMVFRILA
jgi:hypothetical protein